MLLLFSSFCRRRLRSFYLWTYVRWQRYSSVLMDGLWDGPAASLRAHTPDPIWKRVGVPSLCRDQKCPSASCGFSSWEVFISNRAWTPLIRLAAWHVRGYFVPIPAMNAEREPSLGPAHGNHTSLSVTSIFIDASCVRSFSGSLFFPSPGNYHQARQEACQGVGLSHCLLSFWLSKWHRISSCSCLPLWHYNYP